jgi:hypothetical protein
MVHHAIVLDDPRPVAELGDLREFDVRVVLRSTSGVEHGSKACATLRSLKVNGK